ncbi:FecR family protein [Pedobacter sp. ok626]|uniref:FecR family protein n=1 Tax=Pedobacter sp. ok626 TaxID=1761882 RepID=UPI00088619FB|nr:FecR family protein [Pedobacter sp. ok626]SDK10950.1 FecR family protein [Pedobacter sp. ok626]
MDNIDPKDLLLRYSSGSCDEDEKRLVDDWYATYNMDVADISFEETEAAKLEVFNLLPQPKKPFIRTLKPWLTAAASIAAACTLVYGASHFIKPQRVQKEETKTETTAHTIKPGSNKATLTLPNGKTIDLGDAKDGELASTEEGVKIIKTGDGQLLYQFNPDAVSAAGPMDSLPSKIIGKIVTAKETPVLNTMMTPRGGQYEIVLPDGTVVWVNAKTILKFPSTFENLPERRVYLSGEAYFEVRQIKTVINMKRRARKIPFIVQTNTQEITVLGTHFNVNSYDSDEGVIKTTLVEGLVKVTDGEKNATIKPGQVAINVGSEIRVRKADLEMALAWKNGDFAFEQENLEEIMKRVARWYDVDVVYADPNLKNKPFSGNISKYRDISELLNILEATGEVKFKTQGNKITVMK